MLVLNISEFNFSGTKHYLGLQKLGEKSPHLTMVLLNWISCCLAYVQKFEPRYDPLCPRVPFFVCYVRPCHLFQYYIWRLDGRQGWSISQKSEEWSNICIINWTDIWYIHTRECTSHIMRVFKSRPASLEVVQLMYVL